MFLIDADKTIHATRGDAVQFSVGVIANGQQHTFQMGNTVRFTVYEKNNAENIVLTKDFPVTEETEFVQIFLDKEDTKFGEVISKPVEYWYEVELNPEEFPQTFIGYDKDGPKVFLLYPESAR